MKFFRFAPAAGESQPSLRWSRADTLSLGAVLAAALVFRLAYFAIVRHEFWFTRPWVDSVNFDLWARAILQGDWLGSGVFVHSPLYAFFLAGVYAASGGPNPVMASAVQLVLGAAGCGLVFLLARRLFPLPAALAAGLISAAYGIAFFHEGTLLTVVLIHLLNLSLLLSAYWAESSGRLRNWALPGILLGLSVIARPNAILLLPVLVVWINLRPWSRPGRKPRWVPGLIMTVCVLMLAAPVAIRNRLVLHEWLLTAGNGGINTYLGNYREAMGYHIPSGDLGLSASSQVQNAKLLAEKQLGRSLTYSQSDRYWLGRAFHDMVADPWRWLKLIARKTLLLLNHFEFTTSANYYLAREKAPFLRWPWVSFSVAAPLAIAGMWMFRRRWVELFPLYGLVAVYAFSNVSMLVSSEYRYGLMPPVFVFGGAALAEMLRLLTLRHVRALWVPGAVLLFFGILAQADIAGKPLRSYHLATAHANLGMIHAEESDFVRAAEEFSAARGLMLDRPEYRAWLALQLGNAYMKSGQIVAALAPLEEARRLAPGDAQIANDYANALTANGLYQEALALRRELLRGRETQAQYWINYGITSLWAGDEQAAETAFARAAVLQPGSAEALVKVRAEIRAAKARVH